MPAYVINSNLNSIMSQFPYQIQPVKALNPFQNPGLLKKSLNLPTKFKVFVGVFAL